MTPETLPARWYFDPEHYQRERRAIFEREWLLAGHASPVAAPGSALVFDLAGWSLMVVRGDDGVLRGFHNACRHRAGPLLEAGCHFGLHALRCRYHGWTYGLGGELRKPSGFAREDGLETSTIALPPVRVGEWRGLLFVNLDPDAAPLETVLAPIVPRAQHLPLEAFRLHSETSHDIACNWKTYVDNYNEGYHIPHLHPSLARTIDVKRYQVENQGLASIHSAPRKDGSASAGLWVYLYPNAALNFYPTGMNLERIVPLGPRMTRLSYSYYFVDPAAPSAAADIAASAETTAEDIAICLAVQRNLESGAYDRGVLHPRYEVGNVAVQRRIREALER